MEHSYAFMVSKSRTIEREDREGVDYAAAADAFAGNLSGDGDESSDDKSHEEDFQDGSDVESDEDEEVGEEQQVDEDDEDDSEVVDDDHVDDTMMNLPSSPDDEQCTFDLHNLLAVNTHQINTTKLYSNRNSKSAKEENITIPPTTMDVEVNEDYLLEKASDGCTQLLAALWQLPIEKSDAGPMVSLPLFDSSKIPRALVS